MDINGFIEQLNRSGIFEDYRQENGNFTRKTLETFGFEKDYYMIGELNVFKRMLTDNVVPLLTSKGSYPYKERAKDLAHNKLSTQDKNTMIEARKALGMPRPNTGFALSNDLPEKFQYTIDYIFLNSSQENPISPAFEKWFIGRFMNDYKEAKELALHRGGAIAKANKEIGSVAYSVLRRWDLPNRYKKAIIELILFNRLVPANNSTSLRLNWSDDDASWECSIVFDKDTTKSEIMDLVDSNLDRFQGFLRGAVKRDYKDRNKAEKTTQMFSELKTSSSNSGEYRSKAEIYEMVGKKTGVTKSAIRKRLIGK